MLKRLEVFLIAALFILITAIILIIYSKQREEDFKSHSNLIQKAAVHGAAYAINLQLLDKHRHVRLFSDEYARLFMRLNNFPADEKTVNDIKGRLQQRFPDFFAYTITDPNAVPVLMDIDLEIGDACRLDLSNFSKNIKTDKKAKQNKVFIHPQPFHYHYDIMAPLYTNGAAARIFFVSFYLKEITDILKTHELPGQNLMLLRQSDPTLIEVTSEGVRDKITREIRLSKAEQSRIKVFEDIPDTDWRLVNLPHETYEKQYLQGLWTEAVIILLIVTLALFLLIIVLIKFPGRRTDN